MIGGLTAFVQLPMAIGRGVGRVEDRGFEEMLRHPRGRFITRDHMLKLQTIYPPRVGLDPRPSSSTIDLPLPGVKI